MITRNGYSKDNSIIPEGIVITWSLDLANSKGGLEVFCKQFEDNMQTEDSLWLNKCENPPKHDILYVYIIVAGELKYRCLYGGYSTEHKPARDPITGMSWANWHTVLFPHIILAGPVVLCPEKRELKGFQGFRYSTELF
jgi:hypothetical protein